MQLTKEQIQQKLLEVGFGKLKKAAQDEIVEEETKKKFGVNVNSKTPAVSGKKEIKRSKMSGMAIKRKINS
jgi:hemerythrin superfamily protein